MMTSGIQKQINGESRDIVKEKVEKMPLIPAIHTQFIPTK